MQHKLTPSITSKDIIAKCDLEIGRTDKLNRFIGAISATMDKLKTVEIIQSYELIRQGAEFTIKIS